MLLRKINYTQFSGTPDEWRLKDFDLDQINLIIGRNSVGKTRTINIISGLASLLSDDQIIHFRDGNYNVEFVDNTDVILYNLHYQNSNIVREKLIINGEILLERDKMGAGNIFFTEQKRSLKFQTPTNKVAAFSRRDAIQHSFLDKLYDWGSSLAFFRFGNTMGQDTFFLKGDGEIPKINLRKTTEVASVLIAGENEYGKDFNNQIIEDLGQVGYSIKKVNVESQLNITFKSNLPISTTNPLGIMIQENDRDGQTDQQSMSQGMFRSLSTIIQLNYFVRKNKKGTILIDDIGEGLDYIRSTMLIQLLINKIKNSKFQIIMTTNDHYTMNKIPIEYWSILNRDGGTCYSYNYKNSKKIFDEFKLTGLNNFDLFSSKYYLKK